MSLPKSDRTRATEQRYQNDIEDWKTKSLIDVPILAKLSENWHLKYNEYPYDEKWEESLMYVYYKACGWEDIPVEDIIALHNIKIMLKTIYDKIAENGHTKASVKNVPHGHLLRGEK